MRQQRLFENKTYRNGLDFKFVWKKKEIFINVFVCFLRFFKFDIYDNIKKNLYIYIYMYKGLFQCNWNICQLNWSLKKILLEVDSNLWSN